MKRTARWFDRIWYAQNFLRGFILLYPVAAIWMLADGLSPAELSLLFIVWSGSAMAFEVPSGVIADRFPRPRILAVAFLIKASGFSVWWAFPEFAGYAAGFALWALAGALLSGASESFLFESLQAQGRTAAFETVYGRGDASELTGILIALGLGGYLAENGRDPVYFLSIIVPLVTALLCLTLLHEPRAAKAAIQDHSSFVDGLRQGIRDALTSRLILLIIATFAILHLVPEALDEYFAPLLNELPDLSLSTIGLLLAAFTTAIIAGSLVADRFAAGGLKRVLAIYGMAGCVLLFPASAPTWLAIICILTMNFLHGMGTVILQGALQRSITGEARSTVTSLASFTQSLVSLPFYGLFGWYATGNGFVSALTMTGVFTVIAALLLWTLLLLALPGTGERPQESDV